MKWPIDNHFYCLTMFFCNFPFSNCSWWSMKLCVHHSKDHLRSCFVIGCCSSVVILLWRYQFGLNRNYRCWLTVTAKQSGRFLKGTKEPTVCTVDWFFMKALMVVRFKCIAEIDAAILTIFITHTYIAVSAKKEKADHSRYNHHRTSKY